MSRPRVAAVKLRLPWLYREAGGRGGIKPGEQGLVTEEQLRLMIKRVKRAKREGIVADLHADEEIAQLRHGIDVIGRSQRDDVGAWAPADEVIRPRARRR